MSLAESLEKAASALSADADAIRPANGDPVQLLSVLSREAAERVILWLLVHETADGGELAVAWADESEGAEILGAIDERALPKVGRKALRRALHRLRSRGVSPKRTEAEPKVARLPKIEDDLQAAYVSPIDPRGSRLVYLVEPNPSGGGHLFEILLDDYRGVVDFEVYSAGRSRIRGFVKQALSRANFPPVEVPVDALRALVGRIAAAHPEDRALPKSFSEWRSKVSAPDGMTPGDLARTELAAALEQATPNTESTELAAELVTKGSIGPWGPPPKLLAERLEERLGQEIEKPAGDESFSELARLLFPDAKSRAVAAERMRESAYVLHKHGRSDEAVACLAGATTFESDDVSASPVAIAMARVLLQPALSGLRARREEQSESDSEPNSEPDSKPKSEPTEAASGETGSEGGG